MNINNLELIIYKNYKEICTTLEEDIKSGKSKQLQIENWKRYFEFSKEGIKFNVTKIYAEPLPKEDNRKGHSGKSEGSRGNNNKYGKFIDILLENELYKIKKRKRKSNINITNSCLAQLIKMVNYNYRTCLVEQPYFLTYLHNNYKGDAKLASMDVINIIKSKLRPAISGSLKRLQDAGKITYKSSYIFAISETEEENDNTLVATDVQNTDLHALENKILEEMHTTKKKLNYNAKAQKEFYKKFNERAVEMLIDVYDLPIKAIWQGYSIHIINCAVPQQDTKKMENEFNTLFAKDVTETIAKMKENINKKYNNWWGNKPYNQYEKERITSLKYQTFTEKIIELLISYKAQRIVEMLEQIKNNTLKKEKMAKELMEIMKGLE